VTYVFFKYIAADDEEGGQVGVGERPASPPTASSGNGAASQPSQPSNSPSKWSLAPLKRIAEGLPQLPDVGALLARQRLPFGGSKPESAGGGSEEVGPPGPRQQAGTSTSSPEAVLRGTEQVS